MLSIVQGLTVRVFNEEERATALQRTGGLWGNTKDRPIVSESGAD